ncbi:nitrite reductase small subunit NirD [Zoogloea sp.]|jgi:nitrite reductase (NADH) small subunit|uniref:nitrite reductase small subunit NirD n=1 Tax=Zoogloea sp. TaxID=49181 RepID=UPI0035ADE3A4|nr:nitrite reductase small subunit NirD [Azovibrio sp.]
MSEWKKICAVSDVPVLGSRVVESETEGRIAIFRNSADQVFAVRDRCPHKHGPLSQGIVHGTTVTCPLHSWKIQLDDGLVVPPDVGCVKPYPIKVEDGQVYLSLIPKL